MVWHHPIDYLPHVFQKNFCHTQYKICVRARWPAKTMDAHTGGNAAACTSSNEGNECHVHLQVVGNRDRCCEQAPTPLDSTDFEAPPRSYDIAVHEAKPTYARNLYLGNARRLHFEPNKMQQVQTCAPTAHTSFACVVNGSPASPCSVATTIHGEKLTSPMYRGELPYRAARGTTSQGVRRQ